MLINIQTEIQDVNGDLHEKVDVTGLFYRGSLEDWRIDGDIKINDKTAERLIEKLYEEYGDNV